MRPYYYLGGRRGLTRLTTGQMFIVNTDARDIATWIIHAGHWETFVDDVLCALVRPGDTFVDVGANMGYYTIKIGGRLGPQGRLFSFEPNPDLYEVLFDNIRINGFEGKAQAFHAAAGEGSGTARLNFETRYPGGGRLLVDNEIHDPRLKEAEVQILAIDDVISDGPIHLVKIDVEGFEPMVLKGMTRLLSQCPDAAVVTEIAYSQWARFGDPLEMLLSFAGDRRVFIMRVDGGIEELARTEIEGALNRLAPSYILLLPPGAAREAQVQKFIRPFNPAGEAVVEAVPAPIRSGLLGRLRRRLASY